MFHSFGFAAAQIEILFMDWFSTATHKYWEEHDLILYFYFPFKLVKTEVLIYRDVDGDSQTYSYKNMLQTYAANLHKRPCWGVPS